MEIDHDRMRPRRCRPIEAIGQRAFGALQRAVADLADRPSYRPALVEFGEEVACALRAQQLDLQQVDLRQHAEYQPHVRLQANYLAIVALLGNVGAGEFEAQHAAADDLVADAAVGADAAGIRHHAVDLAGNVGARVPGVRQPMQRHRRTIGHVPRPAGLGGLGCFHGREAGLAQRRQAVDHPVGMLLDRDRHVRQHRRAAGPGNHEEVGKARDGEAEIGLRSLRPDVRQATCRRVR